jgi:RNA polymerase sigma factor (sigma-70 family)
MPLKSLKQKFKKSAPAVEPLPPEAAEIAFDESTTITESDESLVARVQKGDPSAFDVLVERHKERLYNAIYQMTANHQEADDLVQESFIKAFRAIRSFQGRSSFYTWIYRIAMNRTLNHLKRRKRGAEFSLNDVDASIEHDPDFVELMSHKTPRREAALNELQQRLNEAMAKLSENHRMVVTLHDIQGLTHSEIAEIVNCSEGTVRSRLFYARQQLQALLSDYL